MDSKKAQYTKKIQIMPSIKICFTLIAALLVTIQVQSRSGQSPYLQKGKLLPGGPFMSGRDSAFSGALAIDGDRLLVGSRDTADTGVAYVYEFDGSDWQKTGQLIPEGAAPGDLFGNDVSLFGEWALIGSPTRTEGYETSGAAMVYQYNGSNWVLKQLLSAQDAEVSGQFGCSVEMSADIMLISACGQNAVYVFTFDGSEWIQAQKLTPQSSAVDVDYGRAMSLSNGLFLVSGFSELSQGVVEAFKYDGSLWQPIQSFNSEGSDNYDAFGSQISLSDNWSMVSTRHSGYTSVDFYHFNGAQWVYKQTAEPEDDQSRSHFGSSLSLLDGKALISHALEEVGGVAVGVAYYYKLVGGIWHFKQKIAADDGAQYDYFGGPLAQSADQVVVGANGDSTDGFRAGAAYVFEQSNGSWNQAQKVTGGRGAAHGRAGTDDSMSGDRILVGSPGEDRGTNIHVGAAYSYVFDGVRWRKEKRFTAGDPIEGDGFGHSVLLKDQLAFIGAPNDDHSAADYDAGSVYLFKLVNGEWARTGKIITADRTASDGFGGSMALHDNKLFIGATGDDEMGVDSGSVYVYEYLHDRWIFSSKITSPYFNEYQNFGSSIVINDGWLFISAYRNGFADEISGRVYVYQLDDYSHGPFQQLYSDHPNAEVFGLSMAVKNDQAFFNLGLNSRFESRHSVESYIFDGSQWVFEQEIRPVLETSNWTNFGSSISFDDGQLLVGAYNDRFDGTQTGSAYLYEKVGSQWVERMILQPTDGTETDLFGHQVILSGNRMVVASPGDDTRGFNSGVVYVYANDLINKQGFEAITTN